MCCMMMFLSKHIQWWSHKMIMELKTELMPSDIIAVLTL